MNLEAVKTAESEARRFLRRVQDMKEKNKDQPSWVPAKEKAAVKRASMDLTRALADLRRSN